MKCSTLASCETEEILATITCSYRHHQMYCSVFHRFSLHLCPHTCQSPVHAIRDGRPRSSDEKTCIFRAHGSHNRCLCEFSYPLMISFAVRNPDCCDLVQSCQNHRQYAVVHSILLDTRRACYPCLHLLHGYRPPVRSVQSLSGKRLGLDQ